MKNEKPDVQVRFGQVWEDCDKRYKLKRRIVVVSVQKDRAVVKNVSTGRITEIKLVRFKAGATGYRLVGS
jgi:hypothetical protein